MQWPFLEREVRAIFMHYIIWCTSSFQIVYQKVCRQGSDYFSYCLTKCHLWFQPLCKLNFSATLTQNIAMDQILHRKKKRKKTKQTGIQEYSSDCMMLLLPVWLKVSVKYFKHFSKPMSQLFQAVLVTWTDLSTVPIFWTVDQETILMSLWSSSALHKIVTCFRVHLFLTCVDDGLNSSWLLALGCQGLDFWRVWSTGRMWIWVQWASESGPLSHHNQLPLSFLACVL